MSDALKIRLCHVRPPMPRRVEACDRLREPVADGRQCRIWLYEARREIDRLRSVLNQRTCDTVHIQADSVQKQCETQPQRAENAPKARRIYAPPAIGDVSHLADAALRQLPPPEQAVAELHRYHVTNVGSLLDVLA